MTCWTAHTDSLIQSPLLSFLPWSSRFTVHTLTRHTECFLHTNPVFSRAYWVRSYDQLHFTQKETEAERSKDSAEEVTYVEVGVESLKLGNSVHLWYIYFCVRRLSVQSECRTDISSLLRFGLFAQVHYLSKCTRSKPNQIKGLSKHLLANSLNQDIRETQNDWV